MLCILVCQLSVLRAYLDCLPFNEMLTTVDLTNTRMQIISGQALVFLKKYKDNR